MIYVRQWLLGVYAVDTLAQGLIRLEFVPATASPLAVRPLTEGSPPVGKPFSLAWGVFSAFEDPAARLVVAAPDGSLTTELLAEARDADGLTRLVPWQWHPDGRLYFTKEPAGIESSRPFVGAANLWLLDPESGGSGVLVSSDVTGGEPCLDAIAPGAPLVAHHCLGSGIAVLNLETDETTVVDLPDGVPGRAALGGVRFNSDGSRIAFAALAGGAEPATDTRGYVMVSDGLSGGSRIVATSRPGEYLKVAGWLSDDMLVLQSFSIGPDGEPAVWVVGTDGTGLVKLADGVFLG
jgi:hypothetical protein